MTTPDPHPTIDDVLTDYTTQALNDHRPNEQDRAAYYSKQAGQIVNVVNQLSNEIAGLQTTIKELYERLNVAESANDVYLRKIARLEEQLALQYNGLLPGEKVTIGGGK